MRHKKKKSKPSMEVKDYDQFDTSGWINKSHPLEFKHLGLKLPDTPPTQVVSIRLPSELLNELKAIGSQQDIPYQALIKLLLAESLTKFKRKLA